MSLSSKGRLTWLFWHRLDIWHAMTFIRFVICMHDVFFLLMLGGAGTVRVCTNLCLQWDCVGTEPYFLFGLAAIDRFELLSGNRLKALDIKTPRRLIGSWPSCDHVENARTIHHLIFFFSWFVEFENLKAVKTWRVGAEPVMSHCPPGDN